MSTTTVTWQIAGQEIDGKPHARKTQVPDGEFYVDWIAQAWDVDPAEVVILDTDEG